jgi:transposase
MYARLKSSKNSRNQTLQIVEGVREGKKVKQRIIASLGVVNNEKSLKKLLRLAQSLIQKIEEQGLPVNHKIEINKLFHTMTVYDGFGTVVGRLMELTGFSKIIRQAQGKNKFNVEEAVKLIIAQRLDLPSSKLRTYERQQEHGFEEIDLHHLYRTMDVVEQLSSKIQEQGFKSVCLTANYPVDCFFFDVTTLYFESVDQDELRDFGFSKDQKHHSVQIVLALVVDREGLPLAYDTFKGNLAETKTLIPVLETLRNRFSVQNVTVVCDRGLASSTNVQALQAAQFHFVIATKLRSISKKLKINDLSAYIPLPNQENIPETERVLFRTLEHPQYEDTLLIATYNPNRAAKDKQDRERLLEKLYNKITDSPDEASIKKVISNSGYKKYTTVKTGSSIVINQAAIDTDAAWDGFHGIAVSNSAKLTTAEALARYRDLWHVEETFRVAKSTLKARPIFHWAPHRIKAHILLCFITLFFERYLELLLRQKNRPLTPDKIRHALSKVHTMHFKEEITEKQGKMESSLTEDAEKIFEVLGISAKRSTKMNGSCCA